MEAVLSEVKDILVSLKSSEVNELFGKIAHGKMMRAKLMLTIAPNAQNIVRLAAIVELIHAASLLHDDVIDEADTRRGAPSMNALHGSKTAIMLGDILYSKAFLELSAFGEEICRTIAGAVTLLSIGELQDVRLSESFNPDEALYIEMIYNKTASLIEACCAASAMLAGLSVTTFGTFGKNIGLAFQIVDDILDVVQDEKTLGKPAFCDFKEGKSTLPFIFLYDALNKAERARLLDSFRTESSESEKGWIKEQMRKHGSTQQALSKAKSFVQSALDAVMDSQLDEGAKATLKGYADKVLYREF